MEKVSPLLARPAPEYVLCWPRVFQSTESPRILWDLRRRYPWYKPLEHANWSWTGLKIAEDEDVYRKICVGSDSEEEPSTSKLWQTVPAWELGAESDDEEVYDTEECDEDISWDGDNDDSEN